MGHQHRRTRERNTACPSVALRKFAEDGVNTKGGHAIQAERMTPPLSVSGKSHMQRNLGNDLEAEVPFREQLISRDAALTHSPAWVIQQSDPIRSMSWCAFSCVCSRHS